MHPFVKIADSGPFGLGLVAHQDIPKGSDLIALPEHVPLKFPDGGDGSHQNLVNLARHVPGMFCFYVSFWLCLFYK